MGREYEHRDTNVGYGWAPHKKGCRCGECEIERLQSENRRLKNFIDKIEDNRQIMERVNAISVNPEMANMQDIINMAEALQDFYMAESK